MIPTFWIVAGPNGAGKSTLVRQEDFLFRFLSGVTIWNPDTIAQQILQNRGFSGFSDAPSEEQRRAFLEAAENVETMLSARIQLCHPVGVETVLSSDKYRPLVDQVVTANGFFGLIYVALRSPELAISRVRQRVREGGHDVPDEKLHKRWHRSLLNLRWFAARASELFVYDNSDENPKLPPNLIAYGSQGVLRRYSGDAFPELAAALASLPRVLPPA